MTSPDPALTRSLTHERAHHDACRAALAAILDGAEEQVVIGEDVSASGADAEVLGRQLRSQARDLRELRAVEVKARGDVKKGVVGVGGALPRPGLTRRPGNQLAHGARRTRQSWAQR